MANVFEYWAEYMAFIFLAIGFVAAASAGSAVIIYSVAFIFGAFFGRWWWKFRNDLRVHAVVVILGFVVGYVLGSFYGSRKVIVILFLIGMVVSYVLHDKKIIHSAEY
jgi:hypothetical protein